MPERTVISNSPEETHRLAAGMASTLRPGDVLALHGELGSGKTCFVQGLAAALGVAQPVHSPTFNLISEYAGRLTLYHVDLYRLRSAREAGDIGLDEYLFADGVTAIEWAEKADALLPPHTVRISFSPGEKENERIITVISP